MASELTISSSHIYASDTSDITFTYKKVTYDTNIQIRFSYDKNDFIDNYYVGKFLNIKNNTDTISFIENKQTLSTDDLSNFHAHMTRYLDSKSVAVTNNKRTIYAVLCDYRQAGESTGFILSNILEISIYTIDRGGNTECQLDTAYLDANDNVKDIQNVLGLTNSNNLWTKSSKWNNVTTDLLLKSGSYFEFSFSAEKDSLVEFKMTNNNSTTLEDIEMIIKKDNNVLYKSTNSGNTQTILFYALNNDTFTLYIGPKDITNRDVVTSDIKLRYNAITWEYLTEWPSDNVNNVKDLVYHLNGTYFKHTDINPTGTDFNYTNGEYSMSFNYNNSPIAPAKKWVRPDQKYYSSTDFTDHYRYECIVIALIDQNSQQTEIDNYNYRFDFTITDNNNLFDLYIIDWDNDEILYNGHATTLDKTYNDVTKSKKIELPTNIIKYNKLYGIVVFPKIQPSTKDFHKLVKNQPYTITVKFHDIRS